MRLFAIALFLTLLLAAPAHAGSFSIDWDKGGGTGFGIHFEPSSHSSDSSSGWQSRSSQDDAFFQYEQARRAEQERAAKELAEKEAEEARRREEERKLEEQIQQTGQVQRVLQLRRQLADLRAKHHAAVDHDMPIAAKLVEDLPQFDALWIQQSRDHDRLLAKIAHGLDHIQVPSPTVRHISHALFLGWTATPDDALAMQTQQAHSPFDGRRYESIYGFALPSPVVDIPRVALDHLLLGYGLPTPEANLERVEAQLKGASIDELVAHSNGAAIAEAMIGHGDLHVKTLRILGGDGALMNLESLDRLAKTHQMQIYVYANAGDVVPMTSLGWSLRAAVDHLVDPASFDLTQEHVDAHGFVYTVLGFGHPSSPPWSDHLHVVMLSTPWTSLSLENVKRNHVYESYYGLLNAMRLLGPRH
jgi:hypothetical protein